MGEWVHAVGLTLMLLGFLLLLRRLQRQTSHARDRAVLSPTDFSVLVGGLPRTLAEAPSHEHWRGGREGRCTPSTVAHRVLRHRGTPDPPPIAARQAMLSALLESTTRGAHFTSGGHAACPTPVAPSQPGRLPLICRAGRNPRAVDLLMPPRRSPSKSSLLTARSEGTPRSPSPLVVVTYRVRSWAAGGHFPRMESVLAAELDAMGFRGDDVVHIEVCRDCRRELALLQRLTDTSLRLNEATTRHRLRMEAQSVEARPISPRSGGGDAPYPTDNNAVRVFASAVEASGAGAGGRDALGTDAQAAEVDALSAAQQATRAELLALMEAVHYTSGYAILTFQTKRLRDAFLTQRRKRPAARRGWHVVGATVALRRSRRKVAAVDATDQLHAPNQPHAPDRVTATSAAAAPPLAKPRRTPAAATDDAEGTSARGGLLAAADATVAPDPSEICWANLELPDAHHRRRLAATWAYVLGLVAANFAIVSTVKTAQTSWSVQQMESTAESQSALRNTAMSATIALFVTCVNYVTKLLMRPLTAREGHPTMRSFECSAFNKLVFAYLVNSVRRRHSHTPLHTTAVSSHTHTLAPPALPRRPKRTRVWRPVAHILY